MTRNSEVSEQQPQRAAVGAAGAFQKDGSSQPGVPGAQSSETGWWILAKIGLFLLVPTVLIYVVKVLFG